MFTMVTFSQITIVTILNYLMLEMLWASNRVHFVFGKASNADSNKESLKYISHGYLECKITFLYFYLPPPIKSM